MLYYYLSSIFVMLCALFISKKLKSGKKVTMGAWLSYLWWGGDPDIPNSVSGLTKRDIYNVQRSWAPVYASALPTGMELFRRLFKAYPETKNFFRMLKNVPEEEYPQNLQFKAHVINIMTSLNMAVSNLHQPEVVSVMMNKLGESHAKRKIKEENFQELKEVLVNMFIEVLHLDAPTLTSWGKTVEFLYKHIFETMHSPEAIR